MNSLKDANEIRRMKIITLVLCVIVVITITFSILVWRSQQKSWYNNAIAAFNQQNYSDAISLFGELGEYQDSVAKLQESHYRLGESYMTAGNYDAAKREFEQAGDYRDAYTQAKECVYQRAVAHLNAGEYDDAIADFQRISGYRDADVMAIAIPLRPSVRTGIISKGAQEVKDQFNKGIEWASFSLWDISDQEDLDLGAPIYRLSYSGLYSGEIDVYGQYLDRNIDIWSVTVCINNPNDDAAAAANLYALAMNIFFNVERYSTEEDIREEMLYTTGWDGRDLYFSSDDGYSVTINLGVLPNGEWDGQIWCGL